MKKGFTLVEVLITIGIIGIVSVITIPNLMRAYKAQKLRTQFLKTYSTYTQAIRRMEADAINTDAKSSDYLNYARYWDTFMKYIAGSNSCAWNTDADCYRLGSNKYKTLSKEKFSDGLFNMKSYSLPYGALMLIDDAPASEGWLGTVFYVDINGSTNPPNILGYDFFPFEVIDGKLKAMGESGTTCDGVYDGSSACKILGIKNTIQAVNDPEYFKKIVKKYK